MDFSKLIFRRAEQNDLSAIVKMFASDLLGKDREDINDLSKYQIAFQEIFSNKNNFLAVIQLENNVIATCHLTIMPSLTMQGSKRMNIEAVRVSDKFMNQGIGGWMMKKAIEFAKDHDVKILQLTTNKERKDAHRFYERLGFVASHEGMKLKI